MNDVNYTKTFTQTLKQKYIYIIAIGVLAGVVIAGVKMLFSDVANRHGDYYFIRTVQVESSMDPDHTKDRFNYRDFLNSPANYYNFIRKAEQKDFDFGRIDSSWKRKSQSEQMDYLKKKIQIDAYGDGVFQVAFHFDANVNRDVEYMKKHGELLADDFIQQSESAIQAVKPKVRFRIVGKETSYPVVEPINRNAVMKKYGVMGFIVGIFGGTVIFYLYALRKEYEKLN